MGKIRYRIIDTPSGILDISANNLHKVFEDATSTTETFIATAGQITFVLNRLPNNVDVVVDRVPQIENIDFTISGAVVTINEPVELNSIVVIRKF